MFDILQGTRWPVVHGESGEPSAATDGPLRQESRRKMSRQEEEKVPKWKAVTALLAAVDGLLRSMIQKITPRRQTDWLTDGRTDGPKGSTIPTRVKCIQEILSLSTGPRLASEMHLQIVVDVRHVRPVFQRHFVGRFRLVAPALGV